MNGVSALMMGRRECSLPWGEVAAICGPGSGFSPDSRRARALLVDSLDSWTVRNKCLLFKPQVSGAFLQQSQWIKTQMSIFLEHRYKTLAKYSQNESSNIYNSWPIGVCPRNARSI